MSRHDLPESLLFQVYCLLVASAAGLAAVTLSSGAFGDEVSRGGELEGPRHLVDWVPGVSPEVLWGALFLIMAGVLIWGIRRDWTIHVLRFGIVVYVFLVISFVSADGATTISWLGAVFALVLAALHLVVQDRIVRYGWE